MRWIFSLLFKLREREKKRHFCSLSQKLTFLTNKNEWELIFIAYFASNHGTKLTFLKRWFFWQLNKILWLNSLNFRIWKWDLSHITFAVSLRLFIQVCSNLFIENVFNIEILCIWSDYSSIFMIHMFAAFEGRGIKRYLSQSNLTSFGFCGEIKWKRKIIGI